MRHDLFYPWQQRDEVAPGAVVESLCQCGLLSRTRNDERFKMADKILAYVDRTRNWGTEESQELRAALGESCTFGELIAFQQGMRWAAINLSIGSIWEAS